MILYILAGLCVVISFFTAWLRNAKRERARLIAKLVASLLFCLTAFLAAVQRTEPLNAPTVLMLAALVLGLIGDVVLGLDKFMPKEHKGYLLLVGGAPFFFGHIVYIALLLTYRPFNLWLLLLMPLLPVLFLVIHKTINLGKLLLPLLLYALVLGTMMMATLNLALQGGPLGQLMLLPGVLFAVSDSSLILNAFGKDKVARIAPVLSYTVSIPYFGAQALFALSVTYL